MFSRSELEKLTGLDYQLIRSLERRKILTSRQGKYSYNQAIFGRTLHLIQKKLNLRAINFAEAFGSRPQDEIDFITLDLMLIVNSGFAMLPSINKDIRTVVDEWLLPIEQEVFLGNNLSHDDLKALTKMGIPTIYGANLNVIVIALYRVRNRIDAIAEDMGVTPKTEKAKKQNTFEKLGNALIS